MSERSQRLAAHPLEAVSEGALRDWIVGRRWFASKTHEAAGAHIADWAVLSDGEPLLALALVEIRFQTGTHEIYQVPLGFRPAETGWDRGVIEHGADWTSYDALCDAELAPELLRLLEDGVSVSSSEGCVEFQPRLEPVRGGVPQVRLVEVEQSNSSVIFDERLIAKLYRRIEAGPNPELELLAFFERHSFPNVPALHGSIEYSSSLMESSLGVFQRFLPGSEDGWQMALEAMQREPGRLHHRLRRLGEVVGAMHAVLGSDAADPAFAPEEPTAETLALVIANLDEEIEQIFQTLPESEALEPLVGRADDVRDVLRDLSLLGPMGRMIRNHGDLHLGQTLWADGDWALIDFEGEPGRTLPERRRKRSPLRDVAGMLRSFTYAASASERAGTPAPPGWEQEARDQFLAGYMPEVERAGLLPATEEATARLLAIFELEKAIYELRYELNNRPDWVGIPVSGIVRLLEEAPV